MRLEDYLLSEISHNLLYDSIYISMYLVKAGVWNEKVGWGLPEARGRDSGVLLMDLVFHFHKMKHSGNCSQQFTALVCREWPIRTHVFHCP